MPDIIKCAGSDECRDHLLRRLTLPGYEWFWNCNPNRPVRRLYVVHLSEILGWMTVVDVRYVSGEQTIAWSDGSRRRLHGMFLVAEAPLHPIDPIPHKGFRGFRYFDYGAYVADLCDVPKLGAIA